MLTMHGEAFEPNSSEPLLRQKLKTITQTRHLKAWHDHSEIANHGHLLVISAIYDPAFYYTNSKMEEKGVFINIELVVEQPFLYIFTRSSSSLDDQAHIYNLRAHDLADMDADLHTDAGVPVHDVIQFSHGDGPLQQVEAGAKIGGSYICVGSNLTFLFAKY